MEVNGPGWILDVEKAGEQNAVDIARIHEKLEHIVQLQHKESQDSQQRSDRRMDKINERFDAVERTSAARIGVALSFFVASCTAIWFVIVQPMQIEIAYLDRRLADAERNIAVLDADDDGV